MDRRSLIIVGMHRSHTSLVAEGLAAAGLFLGDDLIGATTSNAHGHFESKVIVDFHRRLVSKHGLANWWHMIDSAKAMALASTSIFQLEATSILEKHFTAPLVGWKDPRSAFFLEGWNKVLDDPYYIIVVRHPISCVNSLNRRSLKHTAIKFRPLLSVRHFNLWDCTNQCLLDFAKTHPDRCHVIHAPDDLLDRDQVSSLNDKIHGEWNLELRAVTFENIYDPALVTSAEGSRYLAGLYHRRKRTMRIYDSLCERAR